MTQISNKIDSEDIIVSGVRSTGKVHVGNYFGAIRNFVRMGNELKNKKYFFLADLHALTSHKDPIELKKNNFETLCIYLGCGLNPNNCSIYLQSDIPAISELSLYLSMFAHLGELERTVTFKEKIKKQPNDINIGLLSYPVLMSADVLIHKGNIVPVGKDQKQHVEMIRTFGNRFNNYYQKEYFKQAYPFSFEENLINVPSLSGIGKMSKSDNENYSIFLTDSDEDILKKIKKAKTDTGPKEMNTNLSPEMIQIFDLMKLFCEKSTIEYFLESYKNCTIKYGDLKQQLALDCIKNISPIRDKIFEFRSNPELVYSIANEGARKANESALNTIVEVREIMGLTSKMIVKKEI